MCLNIDGICKGCFGSIKNSQKFCLRTFASGDSSFKCADLNLKEEAYSFYYGFNHCQWLKLARFRDFAHRKKAFELSKILFVIAQRSVDFGQFWALSKDVFVNIRRMRYES